MIFYSQTNHKKQPGFSLLEFLLAISLLASISVILGTILFQTSNTKQKTSDIIIKRQELRLIKNLLQRDFNSIVYLSNYANYNGQSGIFGYRKMEKETEINQIYFHIQRPSLNSNLADNRSDPLLHEIGYYLRRNIGIDEYYSLFRREIFFINERFSIVENILESEPINSGNNIHTSLIHNKIISMKLEYVTSSNPDTPLEEWNSSDLIDNISLPQAIIVTINLISRDNTPTIIKFQTNIRININGSSWDY